MPAVGTPFNVLRLGELPPLAVAGALVRVVTTWDAVALSASVALVPARAAAARTRAPAAGVLPLSRVAVAELEAERKPTTKEQHRCKGQQMLLLLPLQQPQQLQPCLPLRAEWLASRPPTCSWMVPWLRPPRAAP